eukprot:TRINITY_DN3245_c0_g1_i1.p1 TRINITY_DN3245_c0_g1~~TRINITY_DN3245_c0_g1_i1.p1  ORF type:complete len:137 (+),score=43.04 TRINITY_DN3245_c0_g1_i1:86-496(+)
MDNKELIRLAASVIQPKKQVKTGGLVADVGSAVLSESGNVFTGVCCSSGCAHFCAETIALGSMMTKGEYKFKKIVATWKNEEGEIFVIPPCGNCRQLMRDIDEDNLSSEVVLDVSKTVQLKELIPYFDLWQRTDLK